MTRGGGSITGRIDGTLENLSIIRYQNILILIIKFILKTENLCNVRVNMGSQSGLQFGHCCDLLLYQQVFDTIGVICFGSHNVIIPPILDRIGRILTFVNK